ncbi:cysteine desulfurase family protein [Taibaiella sp. KBW10]|uniref:cysteine desulfurase family protein n=1 Tax=Taibaiella sp. KBW10 TaxID=2153357 RepID=UPI00351A4B40
MMQRIYFDNAATTALDPKVLEEMLPFLTEKFGNPSSIYSYGRESKMGIEAARKTVAKILHTKPGNIFFTSGGTESSNTAIRAAIRDLGCNHIITSPIEHHATLHCAEYWADQGLKVSYVTILPNGHVDLESLKALLAGHTEGKTLVTLMHANNEIGNLLPIKEVGEICKAYDAIFHCDTVQTVGHYPLDFTDLNVHFATGAGHKFHGPKGVGILYISDEVSIKPMLNGGGQERNMRAGTENLYGIVGFAKALQMATDTYEEDAAYIESLKQYMATQLQEQIKEVSFNGDWNGDSLYTVLNASFPNTEKSEMLLMSLDMAGVCVSGGSACSSGASVGSHVISCIAPGSNRVPVRFSFCKHNSKAEIDTVIAKLKEILAQA